MIKQNTSFSTVSNFTPVYVSPQQMGEGEIRPQLGVNRANKINAITKQCYNQLVSQTSQHQLNRQTVTQMIKMASNRIPSFRDVGFLEYHTTSFVFNTSGLVAGQTYPLFAIKRGKIIDNDISFLGVNDKNAPDDFLNAYGYFTYGYNKIADERQIVFKCFTDCPSTTFGVYMCCLYRVSEV